MRHLSVIAFGILGLLATGAPGHGEEAKYQDKPVAYWMERLGSDDRYVRINAAWVLGRIGPAAMVAVKEVAAVRTPLSDDALFRRALDEALRSIGTAGVPALIDMLQNSSESILRSRAAGALLVLGETARAAVPALTDVLQERPNEQSNNRGFVAGRFDTYNKVVAARALGRMGPDGLEVLLRLMEDPSTRKYAAYGLEVAAGPAAGKAVPILVECIQSRPIGWSPHEPCMQAIAKIGPAAQAAAPGLLELLEEEDVDELLEDIAKAVAGIGEPAVPVLRDRLKRSSDSTMYRKLRIIGLMGDQASDLVPDVVSILESDSSLANQMTAATTLAAIGPAARGALPALKEVESRVCARYLAYCGEMRNAVAELTPNWW